MSRIYSWAPVVMIVTAFVLWIPAMHMGGYNIFTLLGCACGIGAPVWFFVHEVRTAPLMDGDYGRLDELDGLDRAAALIEPTSKAGPLFGLTQHDIAAARDRIQAGVK